MALPLAPILGAFAILTLLLATFAHFFIRRLLRPVPSNPSLSLPPFYTEGLPTVGTAIAFLSDPNALVKRAYERTGAACFTLPIGHKRLTFLVGPKAHEVFFKARDEELDQQEPYSFSVPVFGTGVVYDAPIAIRLQQFRMFANALKLDKLKSYVTMMIKEADSFFSTQWGDSGEVDLLDSLSGLIVLTATRCLLGREIRESMFEEVSKLIHDLDQGMQPISVFAPRLPLPAHKRRDVAREQIRDIFHQIIEKRKREDYKEDDMIQIFMDSLYRDGTNLTSHEIAGLLIAVLFAGQHTSSITSTWTGLELLDHPDVLKQAVVEQDELKKEFGDELSYDCLQKMDVFHNCMKETLRMYPPLIFLIRKVIVERTFGDIAIPEGDYVFVPVSVSGRDGKYFKNPDEWEPDRFGDERAEDKKAPFTYIGFGGGRHGCMGEQFAYLQIKTIWATILRNFDIEAVDKKPGINFNAMVVGPFQPCRIRYKRKVPLGKK